MRQEFSAGGVIVRPNGMSWDVLLLKDMNGQWTFPKGFIEEGEAVQDAARREIYEEVGLTDLSQMAALTPIQYVYSRGGLRSKTVKYFLFTTTSTQVPQPQLEEGITQVQWLPLQRAIELVGYPQTNKKLLLETGRLLRVRIGGRGAHAN